LHSVCCSNTCTMVLRPPFKWFASWVASLELLVIHQKHICDVYLKAYHAIVHREIEMAEIGAQTRVLHIGGGVPFTAIIIARSTGAEVVVLDINPHVVDLARRCVESYGLRDKVKVTLADGMNFPASDFDVIIISLHVSSKEAVLLNVFKTCKPGSKIVYRSAKKLFEAIYRDKELLGKYRPYLKSTVHHCGFTIKASHLLVKD